MICSDYKGTGKIDVKEDCPACDEQGEINITQDFTIFLKNTIGKPPSGSHDHA